jgi:1-deoxy-D-xylulose-5-phosphate reductoisomerase
MDSSIPSLDWGTLGSLEFRLPDREKFPAIGLAYRAIEMGGTSTAVLNAADEIAVHAFLDRRIAFTDVTRIVESVLDAHSPKPSLDIGTIMEADRWGRAAAREATERARAPLI